MILAEGILMATGLLERPTATHVRAAPGLVADLRQQLVDALDREDPGRLYVAPERPGYFDRLSAEPDYATWAAEVERRHGAEARDAYTVLHQNARRTLLDLRPSSTIDTVMGPRSMPLDAISEARWALEVDVVEGLRICKDIAAGGLLKEAVDVFSASFAETYAYLLGELDVELAKRGGAKASWMPPLWLGDSLRVFEKKPFGATLEIKAPKPPDAPPPKRSKGGGFDTEDLKTRSQQT